MRLARVRNADRVNEFIVISTTCAGAPFAGTCHVGWVPRIRPAQTAQLPQETGLPGTKLRRRWQHIRVLSGTNAIRGAERDAAFADVA